MWHFTEYPVKKKKFRNLNLFIYRKEDIVIRGIIKPQISLNSGFEMVDKRYFKRADLWYPTLFIRLITRPTRYISLHASIPIIRSRQTCFGRKKKEFSLQDLECCTHSIPIEINVLVRKETSQRYLFTLINKTNIITAIL